MQTRPFLRLSGFVMPERKCLSGAERLDEQADPANRTPPHKALGAYGVPAFPSTGGAGRHVMNVTLPGHPLHPGVVMRVTMPEGGPSVIHNQGVGKGVLQRNSQDRRCLVQ